MSLCELGVIFLVDVIRGLGCFAVSMSVDLGDGWSLFPCRSCPWMLGVFRCGCCSRAWGVFFLQRLSVGVGWFPCRCCSRAWGVLFLQMLSVGVGWFPCRCCSRAWGVCFFADVVRGLGVFCLVDVVCALVTICPCVPRSTCFHIVCI